MKIKNFVLYGLIGLAFLGVQSVCAEDAKTNESVSPINVVDEGKICKSHTMKDGMICFETIEYSPEVKKVHKDKKVTYRKDITVRREIKKPNSIEDLERVAICEINLTFKYDKKSFVKCTYQSPEKNKGDYFLKPLIEILPEDESSTFSIKYTLYEKNLLEVYNYISDGHTDLFCSNTGDIGVNSDIH